MRRRLRQVDLRRQPLLADKLEKMGLAQLLSVLEREPLVRDARPAHRAGELRATDVNGLDHSARDEPGIGI